MENLMICIIREVTYNFDFVKRFIIILHILYLDILKIHFNVITLINLEDVYYYRFLYIFYLKL